PIARRCGARALLVTGARSAKASGALDAVSESLQEAGVEVVLYDRVGREPTLGMVDEARQLARESACDLIIGLGGGSPRSEEHTSELQSREKLACRLPLEIKK